MGKIKISIQRIEKESNRRVTFNKRRIGLLKKAYEISVLCGVDIALIFFSQNGEMTCFHGWSPIEEVVMKFANIPEHERAKCHVQKYTTIEDGLQITMPRKIENEEVFQEVAQKLYQSHPGLSDRSIERELLHHAYQDIHKEIKDLRRFLDIYNLNMPIEALISSSKDAAQLEFYVQKQLENLQNFKQKLAPVVLPEVPAPWLDRQNDNSLYNMNMPIKAVISSKKDAAQVDYYVQNQLENLRNVKRKRVPVVSPQVPAPWLDSQNENRTYGQSQNSEPISTKEEIDDNVNMNNMILSTHGVGSTYMSQELGADFGDNNTHTLTGWDAFSSDMEIFCGGISSDQIYPLVLPELLEIRSDFPPSSIEGDISLHDFIEDIRGQDSLQTTKFSLLVKNDQKHT